MKNKKPLFYQQILSAEGRIGAERETGKKREREKRVLGEGRRGGFSCFSISFSNPSRRPLRF
jgi:hypothetical protein